MLLLKLWVSVFAHCATSKQSDAEDMLHFLAAVAQYSTMCAVRLLGDASGFQNVKALRAEPGLAVCSGPLYNIACLEAGVVGGLTTQQIVLAGIQAQGIGRF